MIDIPEDFKRSKLQALGKLGKKWLNELPKIVADCENKWAIHVKGAFPKLSVNYVCLSQREDGRLVVLKICFPDKEFFTEAEALRVFNGDGSVQLLALDKDMGAMLLEYIEPATTLSDLKDEKESIQIAVSVMRRLWKSKPQNTLFPHVSDLAEGFVKLKKRFNGTSGPLSQELVDKAESIYAQFLISSEEQVLLHGDLHQGNIIAAKRESYLAIDPKGIIGERAYEAGALLRNPIPELLKESNPKKTLTHRIELLSDELGIDRERIRLWGMAQAVLAEWWTIEDYGVPWGHFIACAEILDSINS